MKKREVLMELDAIRGMLIRHMRGESFGLKSRPQEIDERLMNLMEKMMMPSRAADPAA